MKTWTRFFFLLSFFNFLIVVPSLSAEIKTGGRLTGEDRAKMDRLRPVSTFETQLLPAAPDYKKNQFWAALPNQADSADRAPFNTKYPEDQINARADVFFIHPTTVTTAWNNWNVPVDDPAAVQDVEAILGFCASVFNAAARVYAPYYREAQIYAFFDDQSDSGIKAVELAYRDVESAFLHYLKYYNQGRPFILAGHSQGSIHGFRLLTEQIIGKPVAERLVAAYLIGGTIPEKTAGIAPAASKTDTGVLIGWNSFTAEGDPGVFTDGLIGWMDGAYDTLKGKALLQVNPLSWQFKGPHVPASENPGSLPLLKATAETPMLVSGVTGADASGKVLLIQKPKIEGFSVSSPEGAVLLNPEFGDYHIFDYQLFYESIRINAVERVNAFLEKKKQAV